MLLVLTLTSWVVAQPPCFVANDSTPGWKQVTLPKGAETLAAPEGVDQFRADEPVQVVDAHRDVSLVGHRDGLGVTAFEFTLPRGTRSLEVRFTESLRGAKVDVIASGALGEMSLMKERRVGAASLSLSWGTNDVSWVKVRVHDHLRRDPVLEGWTSVRVVDAEQLISSAAFRLKHSLYYFQQTGEALTLCSEPARELTLHEGSPSATQLPTPVLLRRVD